MYIDLSRLFHDSSKDLMGGGTVAIPPNEKDWPEEWRTVEYKVYPRFPKLPLPETHPKADLFEVVKRRSSDRSFSGKSIAPEDISSLLKYSCGITQDGGDHNPRRGHPSGGGRYPLEVYPIILSGDETLPAGLYHYNIREHALDVLWQKMLTNEDIASMFAYEFAQRASLALVITAVFDRSQRKYGERGYRYILLEAGHIGQNVHLVAEALGLKCCAIAGTFDEQIEKFIDIDGKTESVTYVFLLGR